MTAKSKLESELSQRKDPSPLTTPAIPKRRVILVDDHPIIRERLGELIMQELDLEICGEAEDANTALQLIEKLQPDIAIVDITLRNSYGIELIKSLKERRSRVPILVLSSHEELVYGERAIRAGAKGYLNKHEVTHKIIDAIRTILAGEIYVSEAMKSAMLQKMFRSPSHQGRSAHRCAQRAGNRSISVPGPGIGRAADRGDVETEY